MNLTLIDAFGRFGAKPASRLGSLSAMAADGAMALAGKVVEFDRDRFVIDFTRPQAARRALTAGRRR